MYEVSNPLDRAMGSLDSAKSAYASMTKKGPEDPGPTPGGAMMSGLGAMGTVAVLGETALGGEALAAMGMTGPVGLGVAAALGVGAYLWS